MGTYWHGVVDSTASSRLEHAKQLIRDRFETVPDAELFPDVKWDVLGDGTWASFEAERRDLGILLDYRLSGVKVAHAFGWGWARWSGADDEEATEFAAWFCRGAGQADYCNAHEATA